VQIPLADIDPVEPFEFVLIKNGPALSGAIERKRGNHFFQGADFPPAAKGTAKQCKIVQENLRQDTPFPEFPDRDGSMPLAELGPVFSQNEGVMCKDGRLETEGSIDQQLQGSIGKMILSADYMGDAHQVVIYDDGKIVSGDAVGADDDEIPYCPGVKFHGAPDQILEFDPPCSDPEPVRGLSSLVRQGFSV